MTSTVEIKIQFNGSILTIPVNPEQLTLTRGADNEEIDILGIGKAVRKGYPGLYSLQIESFFPGINSYYYTGVLPSTCVNFINSIMEAEIENNNVAKITTIGLPNNLNMYCIIESFDATSKAGEEEDYYYVLNIKEYKPYGVKTIKNTSSSKTTSTKSKSRTTSTAKNTSKKKTYKVKKGDCLWNIAKAASGKGSNWKKLYNLNKKIIGSNPNKLKIGLVLTLPDGWKGSFKTKKLTATTKKTATTASTKTSKSTKKASSNNKKVASKKNSVLTQLGKLNVTTIPLAKQVNNAIIKSIKTKGSSRRFYKKFLVYRSDL